MKNPILLLSERETDRLFAESVSGASRMDLVAGASAQAMAGLRDSTVPPLIFLDGDSTAIRLQFDSAMREMPGERAAQIRENTCILLEDVPSFCQEGAKSENLPVAHYLCRNSWKNDSAQTAGLICSDVFLSILGTGGKGLGSIMPGGTELQTLVFSESMQKGFGAEAIGHYLKDLELGDRLCSVIANSVDELLMNAIFDAPVDESGRQKLRQTPRAHNFALEGKSQVELQFGVNERTIGVTVIDQMGTIDRLSILRHVSCNQKLQNAAENQPAPATENAGMGLAFIFRSGGSLLFSCEPGVRTEATVLFRRTRTIRESREMFQLLSTRFYRSSENLCSR